MPAAQAAQPQLVMLTADLEGPTLAGLCSALMGLPKLRDISFNNSFNRTESGHVSLWAPKNNGGAGVLEVALSHAQALEKFNLPWVNLDADVTGASALESALAQLPRLTQLTVRLPFVSLGGRGLRYLRELTVCPSMSNCTTPTGWRRVWP